MGEHSTDVANKFDCLHVSKCIPKARKLEGENFRVVENQHPVVQIISFECLMSHGTLKDHNPILPRTVRTNTSNNERDEVKCPFP